LGTFTDITAFRQSGPGQTPKRPKQDDNQDRGNHCQGERDRCCF
jgi:hypothetical protein